MAGRAVRKLLCAVIALIVGSAVASLPWAIVAASGWSFSGAWSIAMLVFVYVLAGFSVATVYTYLNDGGDALRGLFRRRSRPEPV